MFDQQSYKYQKQILKNKTNNHFQRLLVFCPYIYSLSQEIDA